MAPHVTHTGVHDHGFNNLSTYGNLRRLMREGQIEHNEWEKHFYELAIKASGAVQAARWSRRPRRQAVAADARTAPALGYIYSFNGPHSLFVDTMRTIRILGVAWQLGHHLAHENDRKADLLKRLVLHGLATNQYIVFHGDSTHTYDVRGRTAHEGTFNRNDGAFRARSDAAGLFARSARGPAAWRGRCSATPRSWSSSRRSTTSKFEASVGLKKADVVARVRAGRAATRATTTSTTAPPRDGIVYWDDGAPGLREAGRLAQSRDAEPFNDHEPVDSSASAIAAQGLLRLGRLPRRRQDGSTYTQAGLTVARTLLGDAVPLDVARPPGPAAAQRLPPPQQLGPHPAGPKGPVRRVERCGATTTCSSWACTSPASRAAKNVPHVLRSTVG